MSKEITIGILAIVLALFMLVQLETRKMNDRDDVVEVLIDRDKAQDQIKDKMGSQVNISFEQELRDKYYFKVSDPKNDSIYDVYVNKSHAEVQMLRKGHFRKL